MSEEYEIRELDTGDADIDAVYPVIHQLREHLERDTFADRYRSIYEGANYRIVVVQVDDEVRGAAGFRFIENLYAGSTLYIDDLVTADAWRSKGYGGVLVKYLEQIAIDIGANAIRLDSAIHRTDAHRFYEREGFKFTSKHYMRALRELDA
ncbi:MAG: GNAT family N-acetyltransferase [Solirubrobacterales bacterium]